MLGYHLLVARLNELCKPINAELGNLGWEGPNLFIFHTLSKAKGLEMAFTHGTGARYLSPPDNN